MLDFDKSTWTRHRFDEIATSVKDRVDDPRSSGYGRYVGLEHLDPGAMTVTRWGDPSEVAATKLVFQSGDVIFGRRRAYQRKVSQATFSGIASAHALVLRAKAGLITESFLPVFLSSDYFLDRAIAISVGSLSPTVNWRDLASQEFDLPPLDEQERIADLLWAIEDHRRSLSAALTTMNGASFNDSHSVRSALLGRILGQAGDTWGTYPLGELGGLTRGRRFTKKDYVDKGVGCIHYGQIYTHFDAIATNSITFLPEDMRENLRFAEHGDLVIAGTSEDVSDVCKAVAWLGDQQVAVHDDCFIFRHRLHPRFAAYVFMSPALHEQKLRFVSESKVVRVSANNLARIEVPAPPSDVQELIVEKMEALFSSSDVLASELEQVQDLSKVISGQIFGAA